MVMNIIAAVLTLLAVAGSIFAYKLEKAIIKMQILIKMQKSNKI